VSTSARTALRATVISSPTPTITVTASTDTLAMRAAPSTVPGMRPSVSRATPPRSIAPRSRTAIVSTMGSASSSGVAGTACGAANSSAGTTTSA
jgi:hypothetical protein